MSEGRIPVHVDALRETDGGRQIVGRMALGEMTRLAEATVAPLEGDVQVELEFGIDHQAIRFLTGTVRCTVLLECQRCLQAMPFTVDSAIRLAFVKNQSAAEALPSDYDPYLLDGEPLYLKTVVEDEVLLSLPTIARHPEGECDMTQADHETVGETGQVRKNPFAALAEMKLKH